MSVPPVGPALLDELDARGAVLIPGALPEHLVESLRDAVARVYDRARAQGAVAEAGPLHRLEMLDADPAFVELVDPPTTLPLVVGALGWNIHLYHSHLDVHPPEPPAPPVWRWHQDGGRQNLDLETSPRPRLSVKIAYFLSDCSQPGRGNMMVIPGSHHRDTLRRPQDGVVHAPPGAEPVLARPGDALVFDRRLWHSRSHNGSSHTRVAIFCAYTYRWIRPRGEYPLLLADASLSPSRRQLLGGAASALGHWLPEGGDVPLRPAADGASR
jgi:ectoine hydroxylase